MFTGIIHEIGRVVEASPLGGGVRLVIQAPETSSSLRVSDSVSVNGVCQPVVEKTEERFTVVAVEETLKKTTLGRIKPQGRVNLELPLQLTDRLGGHMVLGHVDCVGIVAWIRERETSRLFEIGIPVGFRQYVIPVGSIAVDGVSLTVASVDEKSLTVSIIPYTLERTIFSFYSSGSEVNLEFDMIGKYVERLLGMKGEIGGAEEISKDRLRDWGYDV